MNQKRISDTVAEPVARQLAAFYERSGYARFQRESRLSEEGAQRYKKGDEIRLIAYSEQELQSIRKLLDQAGFKMGKAFPKHSRLCQPVYGRKQVARFLEMVGQQPEV